MFTHVCNIRYPKVGRAVFRTCSAAAGPLDNINMAAMVSKDSRLARLTRTCLALPETARRECGSHAAFLVRKRIFAYY